LPGPQQWTLVDHDADLLALAGAAGAAAKVRCIQGDLTAAGLPAVGQADLATCSALLDLVTEDWLDRLAGACRAAGCGAYLALTYDGVMEWSAAGSGGNGPVAAGDADDLAIRDAVNAHQRRDRGPATALGPDAAEATEARFRAAGYRTWRLPSPWRLGPDDRALALALVDGWEDAALDLSPPPARTRRIRAWAERRRETAARRRFRLTVGHQDLLALPPPA
ncbi:MAG: class I SAM-dependent methyltransferase, partial [Acidobacteriota bacterium]|nr:class I SAM-dependent methyltransferase [Acidobacteriota bacterium]